jgi:hypothetical protein
MPAKVPPDQRPVDGNDLVIAVLQISDCLARTYRNREHQVRWLQWPEHRCCGPSNGPGLYSVINHDDACTRYVIRG